MRHTVHRDYQLHPFVMPVAAGLCSLLAGDQRLREEPSQTFLVAGGCQKNMKQWQAREGRLKRVVVFILAMVFKV